MRRILLSIPVGLALLIPASPALGYLVGGSVSLASLEEEADLVFKGRVLSTRPVADSGFDPVPGYGPHATEFKVLSVFKGGKTPEKILFRHYDKLPGDMAMMYMPQNYHFTVGRSYIVFAKKTKTPGVFQHLWASHRQKEDQGVLLSADERPHAGKPVPEVFWVELTALLKSKNPADAIYAIEQLDEMSGGAYEELKDFDRGRVLGEIRALVGSPDEKVAAAAITALGSRNPCLSDDLAPHWLATVGNGDVRGFTTWERARENPGARAYWKDLAAVVDSEAAPLANRALAVRALCRSASRRSGAWPCAGRRTRRPRSGRRRSRCSPTFPIPSARSRWRRSRGIPRPWSAPGRPGRSASDGSRGCSRTSAACWTTRTPRSRRPRRSACCRSP